jgi:hypothetical protein
MAVQGEQMLVTKGTSKEMCMSTANVDPAVFGADVRHAVSALTVSACMHARVLLVVIRDGILCCTTFPPLSKRPFSCITISHLFRAALQCHRPWNSIRNVKTSTKC